MAEDLKPLDKAIISAVRDGFTQDIRDLFDAKEEENAALRAEVSSLRSEVERLTLSFEVCQNGSKGIIKKWKASEVRERRSAERLAVCLEALEIARRMADDNQNHLEDLNGPKPCPAECDACQLRKALSPAPGSQEACAIGCDPKVVPASNCKMGCHHEGDICPA